MKSRSHSPPWDFRWLCCSRRKKDRSCVRRKIFFFVVFGIRQTMKNRRGKCENRSEVVDSCTGDQTSDSPARSSWNPCPESEVRSPPPSAPPDDTHRHSAIGRERRELCRRRGDSAAGAPRCPSLQMDGEEVEVR